MKNDPIESGAVTLPPGRRQWSTILGPLTPQQSYDVGFMRRPQDWPLLHLPLKRYRRHGGWDAAYMFWIDADHAVMVEMNMYETRASVHRDAPRMRLKKEDLAQIVLRDWRVD